jgi:DNA-binding NtrC family response regulator
VREAEKKIIEAAIEDHGHNRSAAARELGVERSHFYKKCRKLGLVFGADDSVTEA